MIVLVQFIIAFVSRRTRLSDLLFNQVLCCCCCCCGACLFSCHWIESDANYWTIGTLLIAMTISCCILIRVCFAVSIQPMFFWISCFFLQGCEQKEANQQEGVGKFECKSKVILGYTYLLKQILTVNGNVIEYWLFLSYFFLKKNK